MSGRTRRICSRSSYIHQRTRFHMVIPEPRSPEDSQHDQSNHQNVRKEKTKTIYSCDADITSSRATPSKRGRSYPQANRVQTQMSPQPLPLNVMILINLLFAHSYGRRCLLASMVLMMNFGSSERVEFWYERRRCLIVCLGSYFFCLAI